MGPRTADMDDDRRNEAERIMSESPHYMRFCYVIDHVAGLYQTHQFDKMSDDHLRYKETLSQQNPDMTELSEAAREELMALTSDEGDQCHFKKTVAIEPSLSGQFGVTVWGLSGQMTASIIVPVQPKLYR